MDVSEATRTVGGHPVRIAWTDGGQPWPIHGAIWSENVARWIPWQWKISGLAKHPSENVPMKNNHSFNLDLTDWRDQIPWECLRIETQCVFRSPSGTWYGSLSYHFVERHTDSWAVPGSFVVFDLSGVEMPEGPVDWREAIAKRPDNL